MKIKFMGILTIKQSLEAVKRNGDALQYVKDQTEAVALEAVKQDSYALQYVLKLELFIRISSQLGIDIEQ